MSAIPLPDKYRAVKKTDLVEIRRDPKFGKYDIEPTTLCAVQNI